MAHGTQHGSLNDAAPNQGASPPHGQALPADLVDFDLQHHPDEGNYPLLTFVYQIQLVSGCHDEKFAPLGEGGDG